MQGRAFRLAFLVTLLPLLILGLDEYQREADRLAELMNWKAGQTIAEIGSGEGNMSFAAAMRVGGSGHVYTTELDDAKIARLKYGVAQHHLQNVTVVKAGVIDTNLPDDCCDDIFMRRVYHHFKDPARTDATILHALRPGGLLAVIDFPPRGQHGISKQVLIEQLKATGFEIVSEPRDWPNYGDYCVIARKPATDVSNQLRLEQAVTLTRAGQYGDARKMLEGVAEPSEIAQRVAFHRLKGAIASGLKEPTTAANEMRAALALKPADADLLRGTAMAELQAGSLEDALRNIGAAEHTPGAQPASEAYQVAFSLELIQRQMFQPAIEMLQRSEKTFPKSAKIRTLLGVAQYAAGENQEAIASLEDAIAVDPGSEPPRRCLALIVLESSGVPPQRTIDFLCAWDEVVCSALQLRVARQSGDEARERKAMAVLRQAPEENIVARCELGRAYEWAHNFPEARAQMEICVRYDPSPQNHYRLALIYKKLGQEELAQRELRLRDATLQKMSEQTALGLQALEQFESSAR